MKQFCWLEEGYNEPWMTRFNITNDYEEGQEELNLEELIGLRKELEERIKYLQSVDIEQLRKQKEADEWEESYDRQLEREWERALDKREIAYYGYPKHRIDLQNYQLEKIQIWWLEQLDNMIFGMSH